MSCPDHYKLTTLFRKDGSPAEVIDICDELAATDPDKFQAIEYLLRCDKKGFKYADLDKCKFYIERMQAKMMEKQAYPEPIDVPGLTTEKGCNTCKYGGNHKICTWSQHPTKKAAKRGYECLGPMGDNHGFRLWEPRN